jgi:hypothetical protein
MHDSNMRFTDPVTQMTEEQYRGLLLHLRILIVLVGLAAGILLAFAWKYL